MNKRWWGALLAVVIAVSGCMPKVGSEAWCNKMKEKDKAQWTLEETANFTKYCIIP